MDDVESMPERVERFLANREPARGPVRCSDYEPMAGGYSRVMAKATVTWADGSTEKLVLRGDPPAGQAMIETDRAAEWSVHSALSEGNHLSVPSTRHFDHSGEHLGTPCIVMTFCEGISLEAHVQGRDDLEVQGVSLAGQLGAIHRVDVGALPETVEVPDAAGVIDGLVGVWAEIIENHVNTNPVTRYVLKWLRSNKPTPMENVLVHGDFQNPNVMIDGAGDLTMVDWEFAHAGDPREDLGYYNIYSSIAGTNLYAVDPAAFLAAYRDATGYSEADVNELTVGYFTIAGAARVSQQIMGAIDALARDELDSTMAAHLAIGGITQGNATYLAAIPLMDQAIRAMKQGGAA